MEQYLQQVKPMVEALIADGGFYIIDIYVKPTNNLKVFIDGDQGITINEITKINRSLRHQIDELAWYPDGDFSIEVSSPGIDEPIKLTRQYIKNIGRELEIITLGEEPKTIIGKLINADEAKIQLEELVGKKKEVVMHEIAIADIKKAIVQISFK